MLSSLFGTKNQVPLYPELPTPTSKLEYEALAARKFDELIALISQPGWEEVEFDEGEHDPIHVWGRQDLGTPFHAQMAYAMLPISPEELLEMAYHANSKTREWDLDLTSITDIEVLSPDLKCYLSTHHTPYPLSHREFLAIRCRKVVNDRFYCWGTSVNRADTMEKYQHVRGVISFSGWILDRIKDKPNACMCRRVFRIDPKGFIPAWVVNLYRTKSGAQLVALRDYLKSKLDPWTKRRRKLLARI